MRYAAVIGLVVLALVAGGCGGTRATIEIGGGANPSRATTEIDGYGCTGCHTIAGINSSAQVGPELKEFAQRRYIAGRLPNTPANLIRWIRDPQGVDPGNVMPNLGVSQRDARDIAAYLYRH